MSAAEWIAQRRELLDAATEGPWFQDADDPGIVRAGQRSDGDGYWSLFASETGHDAMTEWSDAALIADARTSLPTALDALEAVLEVVRLHRREPATDGSVDEYDYVGELADEFERAIESALEGKP